MKMPPGVAKILDIYPVFILHVVEARFAAERAEANERTKCYLKVLAILREVAEGSRNTAAPNATASHPYAEHDGLGRSSMERCQLGAGQQPPEVGRKAPLQARVPESKLLSA